MASQALYRKWRSQTFGDLIGQEAVVQTLKNALQSGRIAHAYLFCGPRGTGKTSAARLFAKAVNCQNPQDGEPCNECLNCREVTENRSLDVIEIDAASNRGIDEIRDLRSKVGFSPGTGPYKVYVLDEAHMLTPDACNALLKTLEEPPPHVIFVLATTEAHRILPTILSRCQRLDFKRFSVRDTVSRLLYVAQGEGIALEPGAADLMARAAGGGMRDALSLLDQSIAAMGETITMTGVQQMLGLADPRSVRELVEHIASLRGADGLHLINRLAEAGADLRQLSAQVAEYWRALMLSKAGADVVAVLDRTPEDAAEIAQLAESFALDELSLCARTFSQNDVGARSLSIPQLAVELAFIDCLHLHRQRVGGAGPAQAAPASAARQSASIPPGRSSSPPVPAPRPEARSALAESAQAMSPTPPLREHAVHEEAAPAAYTLADKIEELDLNAPAALPPVSSASVIVQIEAVTPNETAVVSASIERYEAEVGNDEEASIGAVGSAVVHSGLDIQQVTRQWEMIKKACRTKSPKLAALLNHAHPVAVGGEDGREIGIQVEYEFHYKKLLEPTSRGIIEWGLKEILDQPCRARFLQKDDSVPISSLPPAAPPLVASPAGPAQPREQRQAAATLPASALQPQRAAEDVSENVPRPINSAGSRLEQTPAAPVAQNGHTTPPPADKKPKNLLEEKIKRDPVVEEIIKTYGAELVEWKPIED